MSKYFIISAGAKKRADLIYDSAPGSDVLTTTRLLLEYNPNNIIYLNTISGNDANDGFTPATAKLTYAGAVAAISGSRQTIQVENDGAELAENITVPTQMRQGARGTIKPPPASFISGWSNVTTPAGVRNLIVYDPKRKIFYNYNNGAPSMVRSVDDGLTWTNYAVQAFSGIPKFNPLADNFISCDFGDGYNTFSFPAGNIQVGNGLTTPVTVTIPPAASDNSIIRDVAFSLIENCIYAVGDNRTIYRTYDVTGKTGWHSLLSPTSGAFLACGVSPSGAVFAFGTDGTQVVLMRKKITDSAFIDITSQPASTPAGAFYFPVNASIAFGNEPLLNSIGRICATTTPGGRHYLIDANDDVFAGLASPGGINARLAFSTKFNKFLLLTGGILMLRDYPPQFQLPYFASSPTSGLSIAFSDLRIYVARTVSPTIQTPTFATSLQDDVAGFYLDLVRPDTTPTRIFSCSFASLQIPISAQNISIRRCRGNLLEATRNTITVSECLLSGLVLNSSPPSQDSVDVNRNTILSELIINNTAATNRERIVDNIIEGTARAAFNVIIATGNIRASLTNIIVNPECTFANPLFTPEFDLQREVAGYTIDSPLVKRSLIYVNEAGQRRDIGAYSAYETNIRFEYERTFLFLKPSEENAVKHIRHNRANMNVSVDGTPDVFSDPFGAWEELVLSFRSLPNFDKDELGNHIAFVDYLDSLQNTRVKIHFDVDYEPTGTVTTAAPAAVGDVFLQLAPSTLAGGDVLTIAGETYHVLYVDNNRAILSRPLHTALLAGAVIAVRSPVAFGEFFYVPDQTRTLSRWYESDTQFFRGLTLRFVRRWPA